jgi:hypothetical protein
VASRPVSSGRSFQNSPSNDYLPSQPQIPSAQIAAASASASSDIADAKLAPDTSRRTRADLQKNEALANMNGAKNNPSATGVSGAGRNPASEQATSNTDADSTVAITISGDIKSKLEQVLNGSDRNGENLRSLIQNHQPFKFQLNNSLFDVQFNNGTYTVAYRSGDNSRGPELASTLEGIFNKTVKVTAERSNTLQDLQNTIRN